MRAVNYLEPRLNAQIVHRPNQDANVVAEYFAKNLVYLPHLALAPNRISELALDHREHGFDVGALVVVL